MVGDSVDFGGQIVWDSKALVFSNSCNESPRQEDADCRDRVPARQPDMSAYSQLLNITQFDGLISSFVDLSFQDDIYDTSASIAYNPIVIVRHHHSFIFFPRWFYHITIQCLRTFQNYDSIDPLNEKQPD